MVSYSYELHQANRESSSDLTVTQTRIILKPPLLYNVLVNILFDIVNIV